MSCLKNNYQKDLYPINVNVKELKDSNSIVEAILANYSGPKSELESIDPTNYNTNTNIFIQDIRTYLIDKKVPENIVQEVEKTLLSRLTQDTQPENESLEEDNDAQIPTNDKVERTLSDYYAEAFSDDRLLRREFEESFGSEAFESLIVNYTEKTLIVGLDDLNRKVDDYIQKELIDFNNQISIKIQTNLDAATSNLAASILNKLGTSSLESYFFAFGGMGGANAGVANAASHLLKKAGDLFGHTFSRATHNGVKHFLAKIGATSMKDMGPVMKEAKNKIGAGADGRTINEVVKEILE